MINKRLLVKNLLAYQSENTFFDKKRQLNLHTLEGKAKFLKHICALSNSNFFNLSYIIVGVEDQNNEIVGDDFFDDSTIQNLVNAYLVNPPSIQYENILFHHLINGKMVGLVSIKSKKKVCYFHKNIYTIPKDTVYKRLGSNSIPTSDKIIPSKENLQIVNSIENNSRNNISHTIKAVFDFMSSKSDLQKNYHVFKENFVICWSGVSKVVNNQEFLSRVNIDFITEQTKLFYSDLDVIDIKYNLDTLEIQEYIILNLSTIQVVPLEKRVITFFDNGFYKINSKIVFDSHIFDSKLLHHYFNSYLLIINKIHSQIKLSTEEEIDLIHMPSVLLLCHLKAFKNALELLISCKDYFKNNTNLELYNNFKEALRINRKLKYNV
jgi:hypothetical protein